VGILNRTNNTFFVFVLLSACSSVPSQLNKVSDEEHVADALALQEKRNWAAAEKVWNKLSPRSIYFPRAFYETQKLSYRLEDWNIFFAKAEIYKQAFEATLYCPELYLLQSFAYTRNCLFADAENSLREATSQLETNKSSQCSRTPKAELKKQVEELASVLRANEKLKAAEQIATKDDLLQRNLWPVNEKLLEKIKTLPLEDGISFVGLKIQNKCGVR
jgi:hypothetical protein